MKFSIGNDCFEISDTLLQTIVRAIDQAVSQDVLTHVMSDQWDTCNHLAFIRGSYINKNLRRSITMEGCEIHPFSRCSWKGRILICHDSHITITITTQSTLDQIPKKNRKRPHYQQSLLHRLNGDLHGKCEQMSLYGVDPFDDESYAIDFADIMSGAIDTIDGYRHCELVYRTNGRDLTDVKLLVLDPAFNPVEEVSLVDYIRPDFSHLTEPTSTVTVSRDEHNTATHRLTTLKPGIKPALREEEAQA